MNLPRIAPLALLLTAAGIGTIADYRPHREPLYMGGYRVLQADFHLHPLPLSGSTLSPWDLAWDAQHEGIEALAITGQNEVWTGRIARWVTRHFGGPLTLAGEEIHGPHFHMIAVGIHRTVSWRLGAADAIDEIHRQGGVAIAAHPVYNLWPAYDARAMAHLDGSEVLQTLNFGSEEGAIELRMFYARRPMAAIASSDWHGMGPPGICRTWVFVHAATEREVLSAIRERRTVVIDHGLYFGAPKLAALLAANPAVTRPAPRSPLAPWSAVAAIAALVALVFSEAR